MVKKGRMGMDKINIAVIGHKFMGRAHTYAYTALPIFFSPGVEVVKKMLCSNEDSVKDMASRWGYEKAVFNWEEAVNDPEIDVIDIAAPSSIHAAVAIAAAKAGKHVFCEKPLSLDLKDAQEMTEVVKKAGVVNMIGFNYRRVPALAFAKKLIEEGKLGKIMHFRGVYQQDWLTDPDYPIVWRLQKKEAGYGSHGDMGAHVVDMARFLVGDIQEVCCQQRTFLTKRPLVAEADGLVAKASSEMGTVDVDDASAFMFCFQGSDAMGYCETTRNGTGHKNQNRIEVSGTKGAIIFDMERMCELSYYCVDDEGGGTEGFRTINIGNAHHPYMENWWPAGHNIGYGDTFVNQAFDFITAIKNGEFAHPDFEDGLKCQMVLEAAQRSCESRRWEAV